MAALQASGAISLQDIEEQYNPGTNLPSRGLSEFYLGGSLVRANAGNNSSTNMSAGVPTSGTISFNDFYSKERAFKKTFSDGNTNQSADSIFGDDFEVNYPKQLVVGSGDTVGSTSTSNAALTIESNGVGSITVTNDGSIEGAGGAAGAAGGNALQVDGSVAVTLVNNGTIKAGGGGGGNGGAGGAGSLSETATASSVTDKTGNKPSFVSYTVDTYFADRFWTGIGSGQFGLNTGGGTLSSSISDKGPVWYSFQVNKQATYSISASINDPFPEDGQTGHRGQPRVDISTAENTASQGQGGNLYGSGLSWSASANLAASTTYYWCNYTVGPYGSSSPTGNFFYNTMSSTLNLAVNTPTTGGTSGTGGVGQGFNQSAGSGGSGGSGGTNAGSGGSGGAGGAFGAAGSTGSTGGNGSGTSISFPSSAPTNGSSGSSGGASGKSIQGVSNVTSSGSGSLSGGTA
tara:strand:+ start:591 stop:1970 length:1380 start_codon:yes stop_codon:yes gene_type:complete